MARADEVNRIERNQIRKTIAIDLDDTLNDFSQTLLTTDFSYSRNFPFSEEIFKSYLSRLRRKIPEDTDLLSTQFSFFKYQIFEQCYQLANARADGIEFMKWLRKNGWRIVICTFRDLRRAHDCTVKWLKDHDIPYDYLFMARNKIVFCKLWGIEYLVDDDVFNIVYGARYGVHVYYPIMEKHTALQCDRSKGFKSFSEVEQWLAN